ncbi:MAG: GNAT family N-acetyltransferase [Deltaproteobacteria bacterium]|nr:GNAT family N-acetyltransferase [Deltaproteobacteria bacterium]
MDDQLQQPVIRTVNPDDFVRISEIDEKIIGQSREDYWKFRAEMIQKEPPTASLVAEMDNKVVGFIIGEIGRWEYGTPGNIGWIDTIGVDPDYQRRGIGQILFREMTDKLKKAGIESMYTFVNWREWRLLRFFESIGFTAGDMINLKLDI